MTVLLWIVAASFVGGVLSVLCAALFALNARAHWVNALGITQIYGGDHCTYREREKFYSYRRDGVTGRMGTFIWIE